MGQLRDDIAAQLRQGMEQTPLVQALRSIQQREDGVWDFPEGQNFGDDELIHVLSTFTLRFMANLAATVDRLAVAIEELADGQA